jgi:hypothetical protein
VTTALWVGAGLMVVGRLVELVSDRAASGNVTLQRENGDEHSVSPHRPAPQIPDWHVRGLYLASGLQWIGGSLLVVAGLA